ncbi:hypothetical protein [Streptomyces sp. NRRL F-4489]|uniref:hypothetical protein n=1 Tax=Streptomyces sp. NRRL F-4489 TaxID=1609095 RepID=UPI00131A9B85|nr:hypothetical protein [Streptomyces sp. NRRL F-4489]
MLLRPPAQDRPEPGADPGAAPGTSPSTPDGQGALNSPWLQFVWRIPDDGRPPEERAAAALHRLATTDPKRYADVCGGSREHALALGYAWPDEPRRT